MTIYRRNAHHDNVWCFLQTFIVGEKEWVKKRKGVELFDH